MLYVVPKHSSTSKANRDDAEQNTLQKFLQVHKAFFQLPRDSHVNAVKQLTAWEAW